MSEARTGRSPPSPSDTGKPPSISSRMRLAAKRASIRSRGGFSPSSLSSAEASRASSSTA